MTLKHEVKEVTFVRGADGRIWKETVAFDDMECKKKFISMFFSSFGIEPERTVVWSLWKQFERVGFTVETIELPNL